MTRRNRSIRPLPTRTPRARKRTSLRSSPTRRSTPIVASAPTAGTASPALPRLDIGMINKFYDLATMQPEVPATVRSHYEALEHTASACISAAAPASPAARSACPLRSGWERPQPCSAAEVPSETANHAGRLSACVIFISIFYFSSGFFSEQSSAAACSRSEDSRNTSCTPSSACFRRS